MTEQPDTDEIRAAWGSYDHHVPTPWEKVAELCDALDDARAARDYWRNASIDLKRKEATDAMLLAGAYEVSRKAIDRAAAAEARVQELLEVGTGLQVRIAAALLVCCNYEWCGDGVECEVRRALTEGTGQ